MREPFVLVAFVLFVFVSEPSTVHSQAINRRRQQVNLNPASQAVRDLTFSIVHKTMDTVAHYRCRRCSGRL